MEAKVKQGPPESPVLAGVGAGPAAAEVPSTCLPTCRLCV